MQDKQPIVAIVGGGIAGLSALHELAKQGIVANLYEKNSYFGGRMASQKPDDILFDHGADFLADNYRILKSFAEELHITWTPIKENSTHRIMRAGVPHYTELARLSDILSFSIIPLTERIRLIAFGIWLHLRYRNSPEFFDLQSVPDTLDFSNAGNYIARLIGPDAKSYLADAFTGIMQFHNSDEFSTGAMIPLLRMMTSPTKTFSIRYTKGGIGAIPEALAKKYSVHGNNPVQTIQVTKNGTTVRTATSEKNYRATIIAVPAPTASTLLQHISEPQRTFLSSVAYASTIVVSFKTPRGIFKDAVHCTYVPLKESSLISGYTNQEQKGSDTRSETSTLINTYLHGDSAKHLLNDSDEAIYTKVRNELGRVCPETHGELLTPYALKRWPLAMPKFDHGHIRRTNEFLKENQGKDGLFWAGDYLNAPWTEGAARSGIRAAQAVVKTLQ